MENKISFVSTGRVWGNTWGGGQCGYPSKTLHSDTRKNLLNMAKKMLADGSLDSGMGYESLTGAILKIVRYETIEVDCRKYTNTETEIVKVGKMPAKAREMLTESLY